MTAKTIKSSDKAGAGKLQSRTETDNKQNADQKKHMPCKNSLPS